MPGRPLSCCRPIPISLARYVSGPGGGCAAGPGLTAWLNPQRRRPPPSVHTAWKFAAIPQQPWSITPYAPYRFFLQAIQRLAPRKVPEPIDELEPLERGSLVHEVQFELFRRLQAEDLLPVTMENLEMVRDLLDEIIDDVAAQFHEELQPAIERVWQDGIAGIRADLREWLRRVASDESGFVPSNFELAFGLASGRGRDRESRPDPVPLDCGIQLRGSIDLVERHADGRIRVTDHKTGKVRFPGNGIFAGGTVLQPVLYSLAAEKVFWAPSWSGSSNGAGGASRNRDSRVRPFRFEPVTSASCFAISRAGTRT